MNGKGSTHRSFDIGSEGSLHRLPLSLICPKPVYRLSSLDFLLCSVSVKVMRRRLLLLPLLWWHVLFIALAIEIAASSATTLASWLCGSLWWWIVLLLFSFL
ncbi:hypothetical protein TYRP_011375 [Tyrophagus putrescentiae]|nr:hypothetical protein TYRP_011375 [Tyrophagus putrescentiae]